MPQVSSESDRLNWRKSRRSMNNGNCTEVATSGNVVVVRDSADRHGPVIRYSTTSWVSFLAAARAGKYDNLS